MKEKGIARGLAGPETNNDHKSTLAAADKPRCLYAVHQSLISFYSGMSTFNVRLETQTSTFRTLLLLRLIAKKNFQQCAVSKVNKSCRYLYRVQ